MEAIASDPKKEKFWFYGKYLILLSDALFQDQTSDSEFALFLVWKLHNLIFTQEFAETGACLVDQPFIGSAEFIHDAYSSKARKTMDDFSRDELWNWLLRTNRTYKTDDFKKLTPVLKDLASAMNPDKLQEFYLERSEVIIPLVGELQMLANRRGFDILRNFWRLMLAYDRVDAYRDGIIGGIDSYINDAYAQNLRASKSDNLNQNAS